MQIVVLDGYTLNPGDNPWTLLSERGKLTVYDRTPSDLIVERAAHAEAVIVNKTPITAKTLDALPKLKFIGVLAAGYDVVDVAAAGTRKIPVCNTPAYGVDAVAQHAFALLLEFSRRITLHDTSVKNGDWANAEDWCYWKSQQRELSGMTMGILGFGNNGRKVGEFAHTFGMNVIAHTFPATDVPSYEPFSFVSLDELFHKADVISLHCPLTDATRELINAERIKTMRDGAIIINTARGPLIHEQDVAAALHSGKLGGYGADVLSIEPPRSDNPLLTAPNTLITPHIAWATLRARKNIMAITANNLKDFQAGSPHNVVNASFFK